MPLIPSAKDLESAGQDLEASAADMIIKQVVPAFKEALIGVADGLHVEIKVTFDVSRKVV
jgi:hypothetical protein